MKPAWLRAHGQPWARGPARPSTQSLDPGDRVRGDGADRQSGDLRAGQLPELRGRDPAAVRGRDDGAGGPAPVPAGTTAGRSRRAAGRWPTIRWRAPSGSWRRRPACRRPSGTRCCGPSSRTRSATSRRSDIWRLACRRRGGFAYGRHRGTENARVPFREALDAAIAGDLKDMLTVAMLLGLTIWPGNGSCPRSLRRR